MSILSTDVLVIGAGPAGTIAAALLKKAGVPVLVVEKQRFPRFVIGESLLPRCMVHLEEAELLEDVTAMNFQKKYGAKFVTATDSCDFNFSENFTPGWTWTWQVQRADFDHCLAKGIEKKGVKILHETSVENIVFEGSNSTTELKLQNGETATVKAKFIIDASGYGRVIPRLFNLDKPSNLQPRNTLFTHVIDTKRPEGIEGNRITIVVIEQEIWCWIIPFSDGSTSVGFVGYPEFFEKWGNSPEEKIRAILASHPKTKDRFADVQMKFEPKSIGGYSIGTSKFFDEGFVLCGNATEFLDPVFSSGVTFAMESGSKAAKLTIQKLKGETVNWETDYVQHMEKGIETFRAYVEGWYNGDLHKIFFAKEINDTIKRQICSVLAGYVWDDTNPFVSRKSRVIKTLAKVIDIQE